MYSPLEMNSTKHFQISPPPPTLQCTALLSLIMICTEYLLTSLSNKIVYFPTREELFLSEISKLQRYFMHIVLPRHGGQWIDVFISFKCLYHHARLRLEETIRHKHTNVSGSCIRFLDTLRTYTHTILSSHILHISFPEITSALSNLSFPQCLGRL